MARYNECRTEGVEPGRCQVVRGDGEKQQQKDKRAQQAGGCHVLMCVERKVVKESRRDVIRWVLY